MFGRHAVLCVLAAAQMMLAIAAGRSFAKPFSANVTSCGGTGDVLINEFMPAPSAGSEWVELFNLTNQDLDISGWQITDGKNTKRFPAATPLEATGLTSIDVSMLNNTGDTFRLLDARGTIIDCVSYDGSVADQAWTRVPDGDAYWEQKQPTRGETNDPPPPPEAAPPSLVINEFVPLPADGTPWVELYNNGTTDAALGDLYVDNENTDQVPLPNDILGPGSWFVVDLPEGFYEATDTVRLVQGNEVVDEYVFADAVPDQVFGRLTTVQKI
jgi:hypothetical protein